MAVELRSVIRKIDDLVESDTVEAYKIGIAAVKELDKERDYKNGLSLLERLLEIAHEKNDTAQEEIFKSHSMIRNLLAGKIDYAKKLDTTIDIDYPLPITNFTRLILNGHSEVKKGNFILESIERKSIFGNYERIKNMPFLYFSSEADAIKMLEDYFPDGRYIVNLVQNSTSLHHSVKIDIGKVQEVNVVENRRTIRLK